MDDEIRTHIEEIVKEAAGPNPVLTAGKWAGGKAQSLLSGLSSLVTPILLRAGKYGIIGLLAVPPAVGLALGATVGKAEEPSDIDYEILRQRELLERYRRGAAKAEQVARQLLGEQD